MTELIDAAVRAFNALIGLLNEVLDFIERIISPVTDLLQRLAGLGIG